MKKTLLGKVKRVLFTRQSRQPEDALKVEHSRALQRNEAAGQRARQVLEEMLARNDGLRGKFK